MGAPSPTAAPRERAATIHVTIDDDIADRVSAIARSEGISRASVVRRALLRDLRRHTAVGDRESS
jgi:predicted transcriptional regulator